MGEHTKTHSKHTLHNIAVLVSISCVLQISESLIPHPIPGLRLGLANMMTLIAMVTLGFRYALEITVLRTILSSFIMGTFMSPSFFLSFSGAVSSTLVMGVLFWLSQKWHYRLSIIGISIAGAIFHSLVQLFLAYFILIKHSGIFMLLPWLCLGAVTTGWFTGTVAGTVCRKFKEDRDEMVSGIMMQEGSEVPIKSIYSQGNSFLHRLPAAVKIIAIFMSSILVLVFTNLWVYTGLFLLLAGIVAFSDVPVGFLCSRIKRYSSLLIIAFTLPLLFNSGTHVILDLNILKITMEGLSSGTFFASRILFLLLVSSLMVRTTSPSAMTAAFAKLLSPLRIFGISEKRMAFILSSSWISIPHFWDIAKRTIQKRGMKKVKSLKSLVEFLSDLIIKLCLDIDIKTDNKVVYDKNKSVV